MPDTEAKQYMGEIAPPLCVISDFPSWPKRLNFRVGEEDWKNASVSLFVTPTNNEIYHSSSLHLRCCEVVASGSFLAVNNRTQMSSTTIPNNVPLSRVLFWVGHRSPTNRNRPASTVKEKNSQPFTACVKIGLTEICVNNQDHQASRWLQQSFYWKRIILSFLFHTTNTTKTKQLQTKTTYK